MWEKFERSWYWLESNGDKSLAYLYRNPDMNNELGFGFNIADGGGFIPLFDLTKDTIVTLAIKEE
jgi:hypothetical protein